MIVLSCLVLSRSQATRVNILSFNFIITVVERGVFSSHFLVLSHIGVSLEYLCRNQLTQPRFDYVYLSVERKARFAETMCASSQTPCFTEVIAARSMSC